MKFRNALKFGFAAVLALGIAGAVAGCSSSSDEEADSTASEEDTTIVVGATASPHAEILEQVKDVLAEQGYTLEIVEFSDYVTPNTSLEDGELDANYFQHITYLENFNEERGTSLVSAGGIHFEPLGVYPGKCASFDELEEGATIAVPNDATNEGRALLLLQAEGLITLADGVGMTATVNDIVDNPLNLQFYEAEAAAVPSAIADVDLAVINGNYALSAGIDTTTAIASEATDSEAAESYVNVIAVRSGDETSAKIQALVAALQSDEVREYIENTYSGSVVATF